MATIPELIAVVKDSGCYPAVAAAVGGALSKFAGHGALDQQPPCWSC